MRIEARGPGLAAGFVYRTGAVKKSAFLADEWVWKGNSSV